MNSTISWVKEIDLFFNSGTAVNDNRPSSISATIIDLFGGFVVVAVVVEEKPNIMLSVNKS